MFQTFWCEATLKDLIVVLGAAIGIPMSMDSVSHVPVWFKGQFC